MKVQDLGNLDTDVLLFGGPYSNLQATQALRSEAERLGIASGHAICTGDVVAYCADAAATVDEIQDWGCPVIAGNCEKQLADGALDCGCGFEEGSVCEGMSKAWFDHAHRTTGLEARKWMADCPDIAVFTHQGKRFAVIHGGVRDISRFIWPTSDGAEFEEEIAQIEAAIGAVDGVVAGHCGLPFERQVGQVHWINAGVIGMPPNDGAPQTRYALLRGGQVSFVKLNYDVIGASTAMVHAGLVHGYHTGLTRGVWPSQDVLPPDLRRSGKDRSRSSPHAFDIEIRHDG